MKVSLIIPAYNEAERLPPVLQEYHDAFRAKYGEEVEIIVVVNGTTDGTEEAIRPLLDSSASIRMLVYPLRIGKGGAVVNGFRDAEGDLLGFVDADGATPPAAMIDLFDKAETEEGLFIASRWLPGADVVREQSWARRVASRTFNRMVRLFFRLQVTDTQCGAKVITRACYDAIQTELGITDWAFDVDLLFQVRKRGFPIREFPTVWTDKKGSKIQSWKTPMEMFLAILRLRLFYSPLNGLIRWYDRTLGVRLYRRRIHHV